MQVLNFRKCDYFSLKELRVFLTYFVDCYFCRICILFIESSAAAQITNDQDGVDPDQQRFTEELLAQQSREYSLGEQAGLEDTLMQTLLLLLLLTERFHISYHPNVDLPRNTLVGEGVLFFFLIYLYSFTGYQLAVKPALVLENHNKAGKSSSQNA